MKNIEKTLMISELLYDSLHRKLSEDEQTMLDYWLNDEENSALYHSLQNPETLFEDVLEMAEIDADLYYEKMLKKITKRYRRRVFLLITGAVAALIPMIWLFVLAFTSSNQPAPSFVLVQQLPEDHTILQTTGGKTYYFDDTVKQLQTDEIEAEKMPDVNERMQPETKLPEYNMLATSSRGTIAVTLSDSSKVWLNAGSHLRYPSEFDGDRREVELVGQAYFEVAHDTHKPFIVKTALAQIKVLGTRFDVNCKDRKNCVTTLVQGCVSIRSVASDSVVIFAGQQVGAAETGALSVQAVDPRYYTAWTRNRFAFEDKALWQIMDELAAWYGITFEFDDWQVANERFTTIVPRYAKVEEVLGILQMTQSFSFMYRGNDHIRIVGWENK